MFILLLILIVLLLIIIILFSFPRFSPIPYFPTNKTDLPLIIKALGLKNNQTVIDLGAGDGRVIFGAAKQAFNQKLNTAFIAVEINLVLVIILYLRRLFHPNKKNIKIIWGNLFKVTMKQFNNVTFYLYASPRFIVKIFDYLKTQFNQYSLVSYMYPIKSKQPTKILQGINKIYLYQL